jgi:hypothetical protein
MNDTPDNRAKLLVCAVLAAWLLIAFALFAGDAGSASRLLRVACWIGLPGFVIGLPVFMAYANRRRIREAVEAAGGRVESLSRLPLSQQDWWHFGASRRRTVKYAVTFTDLLGRRHQAVCRSSFLYGVTWLDDSPENPAGESFSSDNPHSS